MSLFQLEEDDMFGEREGEGTTGMLDVNNNEESRLAEETRLKEMIINQLRSRLIHLEKARMDKVPVDTAQEISKLHSTLVNRPSSLSNLDNSVNMRSTGQNQFVWIYVWHICIFIQAMHSFLVNSARGDLSQSYICTLLHKSFFY